ncbi:hypothetical protein [Paenibacillus rhizophilus]|uniref:hypothetical protein n=1 Tax=Paenibacillus rhizophilus TaxID=1850366 RepID=UPI00163AF7B0|nr:hypothetical protein [Paenibacillus rhizophilus]
MAAANVIAQLEQHLKKGLPGRGNPFLHLLVPLYAESALMHLGRALAISQKAARR